ncbi:MAG: tetratricopeptide repeat protein [Calditrichaeota bacterium]|nr:tetratricopeptide repeat protein [Calditrichota bacterium]
MKHVSAKILLLLIGSILCGLMAQDATLFIQKGDSAYAAMDNQAALDFYLKAVEADANNYEALWKLSRAYVDVGEKLTDKDQRKEYFKKAEEAARKAIEVNPNGSKGHLYLSIALGRVALDASPKERIRLSKEIKAEVDKALELDPNDDIAWHVLGRWHRKLATLSWIEKKFANIFLGGVPKEASVEKAAECFQKAIELKPDHINHHLELAITYEKLGQKDKAIEEYKKVLELPKKDADDDEHKAYAQERLKKLQ